MKQISLTIIKVLLIILIMNLIFMPKSEASAWGEIFEEGDKFLEEGKKQESPISGENAKTQINQIYNIFFSLGVVITVLVGAILGIKYMFGSIEEQVKVKETLFPYLIGCIVIFSAFAIWKIVINILAKIS